MRGQTSEMQAGINRYSNLGGIIFLFLILAFYMIFLDIRDPFIPRRPGMMRLFFWPTFACYAALGANIVSQISFAVLIGVIKLFTWRDVKND